VNFLSAASFLGHRRRDRVHGYDSFVYSVGWVVAWPGSGCLLIARCCATPAGSTMGDVLAYRMRQRPVRIRAGHLDAADLHTSTYSPQIAGAGGLVSLAAEHHQQAGPVDRHRGAGAIMILYVLIGRDEGHHLGADHQGHLAAVVHGLITIFPAGSCSGLRLLRHPWAGHPTQQPGQRDPRPGQPVYGKNELDFVSLALALVLGICSLPHVLMRFFHTRCQRQQVRRSLVWAIWSMVGF